MVPKTISTTRALIADGVALDELLHEVPETEGIRAESASMFIGVMTLFCQHTP